MIQVRWVYSRAGIVNFEPEIDHGNHLAAQINDAFDVGRGLRNLSNVLYAHDLPYFLHLNSELFFT